MSIRHWFYGSSTSGTATAVLQIKTTGGKPSLQTKGPAA